MLPGGPGWVADANILDYDPWTKTSSPINRVRITLVDRIFNYFLIYY
jgi:hypothetical protein